MGLSKFRQEWSHDVFTHETYWTPFSRDLRELLRFHLRLHCPFISYRKLQFWMEIFSKLIDRGIVVCVFLQDPSSDFGNAPNPNTLAYHQTLVESLIKIGVHVNIRPLVHEKVYVFDECVLYDGSINILSHYRTSERINRFTNPEIVRAAIKLHQLDECKECMDQYASNLFEKSPQGLARQLAKHRVNKGISQSELARMCGQRQSRISDIENGKPNVTLNTLFDLSSQLEVEPMLVPKLLVPCVTKLLQKFNSSQR